jgi:hypothetical protein
MGLIGCTSTFFLSGCATTGISKNTVKETENVVKELELVEKDFYLIIRSGLKIVAVDDKSYDLNPLTKAGTYDLTVVYSSGNKLSSRIPIIYTFEKGKTYYLDYEIEKNNINIFWGEHDKNIYQETKDKLDATYFAFSRNNPNYLEGKWKGIFKLWSPILLTFNENKINIFQDNIGPDVNINGNFYYDDKTIIIHFDKQTQV